MIVMELETKSNVGVLMAESVQLRCSRYQLLSCPKGPKFQMALLLWFPGHSGRRSVRCALT